jgi:hypothetical protein
VPLAASGDVHDISAEHKSRSIEKEITNARMSHASTVIEHRLVFSREHRFDVVPGARVFVYRFCVAR